MMKILIVISFLIYFGSSIPMNCIGYNPFSNPNYPSKVDLALNQDLRSLSSNGFTFIKTYYSQYYGHKIAAYARKYNLTIVLGIWMEDSSFLQSQIDAAIHSCLNYSNVIALYAGNENLPNRTLESILFIKNKVRNGGCNKPFGTVQTIGYLLSNVSRSFIDQMDWLGYNVYHFFLNWAEARQ
jgi:exo-beta-1,3-glucanase (GH17 family)